MDNSEDYKTLTINNTLYAKYCINNNVIFIKVEKTLPPFTIGQTEDYLIQLIELIEQKEFFSASYLNV